MYYVMRLLISLFSTHLHAFFGSHSQYILDYDGLIKWNAANEFQSTVWRLSPVPALLSKEAVQPLHIAAPAVQGLKKIELDY